MNIEKRITGVLSLSSSILSSRNFVWYNCIIDSLRQGCECSSHGISNLRLNLQLEFEAKIGSIRARDKMLVSKSIYSRRGIQWYIYKNSKITKSHKHVPFWPKMAEIRSIRTKDKILVSKVPIPLSSKNMNVLSYALFI